MTSPTSPLSLHGLTIEMVEQNDGAPLPDGFDVRWAHQTSATVAAGAQSRLWDEQREDGRWTHLAFADGQRTYCRFSVAPEGSLILSQALPEVRQDTLFTFFAEPVMRVVFRHRRIVSFHAAALARGGRAIMLVGPRGAGKSSFSAALALCGWKLLADDLTRLMEDGCGQRWMVAAGYPQSKLAADSAAALGYDLATLDRRWSIDNPVEGNKFVVSHRYGDCQTAVPLNAIYLMQTRHAGDALLVDPLTTTSALRAVLGQISPGVSPVAAFQTATALLRDVAVAGLTLPHDLARLAASAAAL